MDTAQLSGREPETEFAHQMAKLIFVCAAAAKWHNERLRINRTTYSPQSRECAIHAADNALSASIEIALAAIEGS